jgi:hypothetical protein
MTAVILAVLPTAERFSSADIALAWKSPHYVSNWSCSSGNNRGRAYAKPTGRFGSRSAVCGRRGRTPSSSSSRIPWCPGIVLGLRLFWRLRSRPERIGRPSVSMEVQQLIRRIKSENPSWGAPRIHGELLQLGFDISEPTVSRYLHRLKRLPDKAKVQRWLAFLQNHREVIAAFDFFTVPTLSFRVLYCFFVIEHHRRRILHFNTTAHPTSDWILQQLREALPLPCPYR